MSTTSIQIYRPRICYDGNHDWKKLKPDVYAKIGCQRVLLVHWVCMDCFALSQYRENVR